MGRCPTHEKLVAEGWLEEELCHKKTLRKSASGSACTGKVVNASGHRIPVSLSSQLCLNPKHVARHLKRFCDGSLLGLSPCYRHALQYRMQREIAKWQVGPHD